MGVNIALLNGFETEDVIIPVASLPYYRYGTEQKPGSHRIFRFDNGFGVSVIPEDYNVDWEAFVIKFTTVGMETKDFDSHKIGYSGLIPTRYDICYDSACSRDEMSPHNVTYKGLQRLCKHVKAMSKSGNFRGTVRPKNMGYYWEE